MKVVGRSVVLFDGQTLHVGIVVGKTEHCKGLLVRTRGMLTAVANETFKRFWCFAS